MTLYIWIEIWSFQSKWCARRKVYIKLLFVSGFYILVLFFFSLKLLMYTCAQYTCFYQIVCAVRVRVCCYNITIIMCSYQRDRARALVVFHVFFSFNARPFAWHNVVIYAGKDFLRIVIYVHICVYYAAVYSYKSYKYTNICICNVYENII